MTGASTLTGAVSCEGALTVAGELQGSTGDGFLEIRGDSGASIVGVKVLDTGKVQIFGSAITTAALNVKYQDGAGSEGLHVNHIPGDAGSSTAVRFVFGASTVGTITNTTTATAYNTSSDERLKRNIRDSGLGLETLRRLRVRDYEFHAEPDEFRTGFIAQELFGVYPYAVHRPKSPDDMWGVDYGRITPLLARCIQQLDERLARLEAA